MSEQPLQPMCERCALHAHKLDEESCNFDTSLDPPQGCRRCRREGKDCIPIAGRRVIRDFNRQQGLTDDYRDLFLHWAQGDDMAALNNNHMQARDTFKYTLRAYQRQNPDRYRIPAPPVQDNTPQRILSTLGRICAAGERIASALERAHPIGEAHGSESGEQAEHAPGEDNNEDSEYEDRELLDVDGTPVVYDEDGFPTEPLA